MQFSISNFILSLPSYFNNLLKFINNSPIQINDSNKLKFMSLDDFDDSQDDLQIETPLEINKQEKKPVFISLDDYIDTD